MKKLVLIDSNAIIHRAYHALPKSMSTSKGELTNAVYGYTTTLIKILEDLKPEYIAACFDVSKATLRREVYKEYKANRVMADQELYDQIPRVKELLGVLNIPIFEKEGYEADDVIGTIATRIQNTDNRIQIYIVSGDKDLFQLLNGEIFVYWLKKGLSESAIVDSAKIKEDFNLEPSDFIDLKALAGDASDNIPGVPNVGTVTATKLIQQFDTLDNLYGQIAKLLNCSIADLATQQFNNATIKQLEPKLNIRARILELLITNYEQAKLSQQLATIERNVPIDFSLEDCKWGEYDKDKLKEFFERMQFRSLLKRFDGENRYSETEKAKEQEKKDSQLKLL